MQQNSALPPNSPTIMCDQLVWLVKNSNLNFHLEETPFSLKLDIKKTFVNKWTSASPNFSYVNYPPQADPIPTTVDHKLIASLQKVAELEAQNLTLEKEIKFEKNEKNQLQSKLEKTCNDLEVLKIESDNLNKNLLGQSQKSKAAMEGKNDEIKVLKSVIKKNNDEIGRLQSERKETIKIVKSREKDIHNLETKTENLLQSMKNLKDNNNMLKNENKKLVKTKNQMIRKTSEYDSGKVKSAPCTASTSTEDLKVNPCDLCKSSFSNKGEVKDHIVTPKLDYPCHFCEKEFEEFKGLIMHIKSCHKIPSCSTLNKYEVLHDSENNDVAKVEGFIEMSENLTENEAVSTEKSRTLITADQFKQIVDEVFGKYDWYNKT